MVEELEKELRIRGFSKRTMESYLFHNRKFLEFVKKDPRFVAGNDIRDYIEFLIKKECRPRTVNLALSALKFYYDSFMNKRLFYKVKRMKQDKKLPTVLSREEIAAMIKNAKNPKHRLLIEVLYSAGLRVSECINLKLSDFYISEKAGIVRSGKGSKDRYFILSDKVLEDLKQYMDSKKGSSKSNPYIFESYNGGHITPESAQKIVKKAAKKAGIMKNVYPHALRASFATHLLENGADTHYVQKLLGHADPRTTEMYLNTGNAHLKEVRSPLDML